MTFDNLDMKFETLRKTELTQEEAYANSYINMATDAIFLLLSLYREFYCYNTGYYRCIFEAIHAIVEKRLVFHLLVTKYDSIIDYEKVKNEDGTYSLKEVVGTKYRNTGVIYDPALNEIIDLMFNDYGKLIEYSQRMKWIKYIINIHEILLRHIKFFFNKDLSEKKDAIINKIWFMCNKASEIAKENEDYEKWTFFKSKRDFYKRVL